VTAGRSLLSTLALLCATAGGVAGADPAPASIENLKRSFVHPPEDSKIMMRWWWFGPAVTKPGLEREMRRMKEAGIGGVEVQPVYPLALDDAAQGVRNLPYLSGEFIDSLRFASDTARKLGLRLDLTLGSGWPYGGPHIPIAQAAGRLRIERVRVADGSRRVIVPGVTAGERLIAAFLGQEKDGAVVRESLRQLESVQGPALWLPAAGKQQVVLFFVSSRTGMMVKRAAIGAEGFVLDHYDRAALETHLKAVGDRLMLAFGTQPPRAVFCDSLEVFASDWTPDFAEQFLKRRGYDIRPHLPALALEFGPETRAIRMDWGRTLTELADERFLTPLREWAHKHGTLTRVQSYGLPPVELSSYSRVDLPEGEGAQWRTLTSTRWASSAGHLYSKPVISSETWTWLHSPSFRATPLDVKAEADLHFLQGVNQLVGHGWPYTPEGMAYPGARFYASTALNDKNPWWIAMPDLALYLQRVSHLLRQGRPANDVAIYLSNSDGWARLAPGRVNLLETERGMIGPDVIPATLDAGYGFDFIDDAAIEKLGRVEKGVLEVGPNRYRAVILPGVESAPAAVLERLSAFAKAGGALIATRRKPDHALSAGLFDGPSAPARFVPEEKTGLGPELAKALAPDVSFSPAEPGIGFIHRSAAAGELYFLANTAATPKSVKATFRAGGLEPEWWDPLTGEARRAEVVDRTPSAVTVALELAPYGSRVLVFSSQRSSAPPEPQSATVADLPLDGWSVSLGGKTFPMEKLRSWTEDEETRYYSGVATYEKKVVVPEALLAPGLEVRLDFGEGRPTQPGGRNARMQAWFDAPVREAAVVYVNGQRAGSVWCPPYSIDVTALLRPGGNDFRIVVGNLAINAMAGAAKPDYRLLTLRYGERFSLQDADALQPLPSGLLGPIRLVARKK